MELNIRIYGMIINMKYGGDDREGLDLIKSLILLLSIKSDLLNFKRIASVGLDATIAHWSAW